MARHQLELWSTTASLSLAERAREHPVVATMGTVARLTPRQAESLQQLDARVDHYVDNARASRTRLAYERDLRAFARWCETHLLCAQPASSDTLARYLTQLVESGKKLSTMRRARIAIGLSHAEQHLPRPDRDPSIRLLERGMARTHGTKEAHAAPLLLEHVATIIAALGVGARADRDRAVMLLGFWGAFRSSELSAMRVEHVALTPDDLRVHLPFSKHDPLGSGEDVELAVAAAPELCPVRATRRWLDRVGRDTGPLFRQIRGEHVSVHGIQPRVVSRLVDRLARLAAVGDGYSAHSLRAGLATSAYARGASEREIQTHGRWKDRRSLDRYIQPTAVPGRKNLVAVVS
jgi:integrase